jgi:ATP-dependent helicase/nuclease subunit A
VELAGTLTLAGRPRRIRGKIDRLVVMENEVVLADYKTNRIVPQEASGVSEQYLAQMALYRDLLRLVYPDKDIRPVIIWTANASIMGLDNELLDKQIELLNSA